MNRRSVPRTAFFDRRDALDVGFRIELARRAFKGHVADLAVDRPLRAPGAIVFADDRPGDTGVAVGIAPSSS